MSKIQNEMATCFAVGQSKVKDNYASIIQDNGVRIFQLHGTQIVKFDPKLGIITIKHGGYKTATTKSAINEVLRVCGWPIQVVQDKKVWYVQTPDKKIVFPAGGFIKLDIRGKLVEPLLVTLA